MTYGPIEPIRADHETAEFDCGSDAQTLWLRKHALQADRTDTAKVRVVTRAESQRVIGYYALSAGSVSPDAVTARLIKGVGRYPIPVVVLTRLGVDTEEQGRGLGRALLKDALLRVEAAADQIGARALLIHCEDDQAKAFYESFADFEPSPVDPLQLLLLRSDLRRTLAQVGR